MEATGAGTASITCHVYYYYYIGSCLTEGSTTDAFTIYVTEAQEVVVEPTSVSLGYSSITMREGQSSYISASLSPSNASASLAWSSSDSSAASVSGGYVTANSVGSATITVRTSNGKTDSCAVTVLEPLTELSSSAPSSGAVNVSVDIRPSVTFTAPITAVDLSGARLVCGDAPVAATATIQGKALSFTPAEQLHTTSGYAGFDFDGVWAIDLEQNSGYPILNSPIKGVHAEDCVTDYDGELHSVVVTAPEDVSVAYSLDAESYFAEPPVFLSAPLPTQVFYRAERGDDTLYGVALMWLKPVVSAVTAAYADVIMPEGGTLRLEAAATAPTEALASLTWACDKPDILALDSATGRIRALAAGTATVTAQALDGGEARAIISVTVLDGERVALPKSTKSINADALSGIAATSVDARQCSELTSIGSRAFADNAALRLIVLGDGVELISADAFEGSDSVRIRCPKDSPAMLFAQENGIPYDCLTAE